MQERVVIIDKEYKRFSKKLIRNINVINTDEAINNSFKEYKYICGNKDSNKKEFALNLSLRYNQEKEDRKMLAKEEKRIVKNYFKNLLVGKEAEAHIRILSSRPKALKR